MTTQESKTYFLLGWAAFVFELASLALLFCYAFLLPLEAGSPSKLPGVFLISFLATALMILSGKLLVIVSGTNKIKQPKLHRTPPFVVGLPALAIVCGPLLIGAFLRK